MVIFEALSLNEPPLNSYSQFAFPFFICESPKALLLHKGDKKRSNSNQYFSCFLTADRMTIWESVSFQRYVKVMIVLWAVYNSVLKHAPAT